MREIQNRMNLEYYYLMPGFSTDFKGRQNPFNYEVVYYFDLNENEKYVVTIEKISISKLRLLEKSQFADDLQGEFFYNRDPFYLSISFDSVPDRMMEDGGYYKSLCNKIAQRFLTALLIAHPELQLLNPVDFVVYQLKGCGRAYTVQRETGMFGRSAYYVEANQYVALQDIETDIFFIYKVLEMLQGKIPEYLLAALSIFIDTYRVSTKTTKALYLLSAIELIFDNSEYDISAIKMPSLNGRLTISNFLDFRNDLAHGRGVTSNILSGLLELCQILLFDSLACLCADEGDSKLSEKDLRKYSSEQVVEYTRRDIILLDRLRPCCERMKIVPKFQNELQ